jgi:pimeloyl-ACP methyl ester carboxylesterase
MSLEFYKQKTLVAKDGVTISYLYSDNPAFSQTVVLCPPVGLDETPMDAIAKSVYASGRNVLAFFGRPHSTGADYDYRKFGLQEQADDLLLILDHIGCEKSAMVGWSTGGFFALKAAMSDQHQRLGELVILGMSSPYLMAKADLTMTESHQSLYSITGAVWDNEKAAGPLLRLLLDAAESVESLDEIDAAKIIMKRCEEDLDFFRKYAVLQYQILREEAMFDNLDLLKNRVHVIAMEGDDMCGMDDTQSFYAALGENKKMNVFKGNHMDLIRSPEVVQHITLLAA